MTVIKCPNCSTEIPNNDSDDFRMRFETLIEDIKYTKDRQWTITYYLLLLYSGLLALGFYIPCHCCGIVMLLGIFGAFILYFGWSYLNDLIKSIREYREYLFITILPKLSINEPEIKTLKLRYDAELKDERDKRKRRKQPFVEEDEKQFVIDLHVSAKDSKIWRFRTLLISAFILQLLFLKGFIPLIKHLFSWSFNC
jgi:hypothetical protein